MSLIDSDEWDDIQQVLLDLASLPCMKMYEPCRPPNDTELLCLRCRAEALVARYRTRTETALAGSTPTGHSTPT